MSFTALVLPPGWIARLWGAGRAQLAVPLFRNAYALVLNTGLSSALGLVFWVVAAHHSSPAELGRGSALVSALMLLAGCAQLGLLGVLVRFTGPAGRHGARLIIGCYAASATAAVIIGTTFVVATARLWPDSPLRMSPALSAAFVAALVAWCLFTLQDGALTGLRQATWIPAENAVFGLLKLVLLVTLGVRANGDTILVSWVLSCAVLLLPVNVLIFRHLLPGQVRGDGPHERLGWRAVARFASGDFVGSLAAQAQTAVVPLLVAGLLGPSAAARFYVAWIFTTTFGLIAGNLAWSLTVEVGRDETRMAEYLAQVTRRGALLLGGLVAVTMVAAPLILSVFGSDYAAGGATLLRLLAIGALLGFPAALAVSVARVERRTSYVAKVYGGELLMMMGLTTLLVPRLGLAGVGVAFAVSKSVVAVVVLPRLRQAYDKNRSHRRREDQAHQGRPASPAVERIGVPIAGGDAAAYLRLRAGEFWAEYQREPEVAELDRAVPVVAALGTL